MRNKRRDGNKNQELCPFIVNWELKCCDLIGYLEIRFIEGLSTSAYTK